MKKLINIQRFKFYLWVGLAFVLLGIITNYTKNQDAFLQRVLNNIWAASYLTVLNYFFFERMWQALSWRKIFKSLLLIVAFIFLYSLGAYIWKHIGMNLHVYTALKPFPSTQDAISDRMEYSMESLFFFGIIRHIYNYIKLKQASQQLRIEKQQAELNYLKSQTNPHFLFNTLNNIYSLARDKSDLAPESILRLSKMLRYMLYETSGNYIAIEQELKIISDYIALERLRYDESLHVNFNYDIEDMKQALPPLLLIPLIENAFKHGVSETRNRPFVDIHLSVKQRQLTLIVKNSVDEFSNDQSVKENIGLSNLRRQLELLYTDYNLTVQRQQQVFTASLKINLASHV
jgi:LytS/YehU family sensor histidine kinase